ncbi:MAG: hypothetical protein M1825_004537 [Sarcosagium campestre]|nr:MAG: hypothetical protein M1825_004537 [Sarcosagium campestre]
MDIFGRRLRKGALHTRNPKTASMVFPEPAVNVNTLWQVIGRVHRIGQTEVVRFLNVITDGNFDRTVEYN